MHSERFPGVLIDDVEQLQPPLIRCFIELKIDGPHIVWVRCSSEQLALRRSSSLAFGRTRSPEAFFSPQTLGSLAIDHMPLSSKQRMSGLPSPSGVGVSDLAQSAAQLVLIGCWQTSWPALRSSVLIRNATRPSLGYPEAFLQAYNDPAATLRGQKFPRAISFSMSLSSA